MSKHSIQNDPEIQNMIEERHKQYLEQQNQSNQQNDVREDDVDKIAIEEAKKLHDKSKHEDWDIYNQVVYEDAQLIKIGYNKAKTIQIREQALFLRWLLKHYSTHTTEDGFVCYVDSMGKETDIKDIINHYNDERS